MTFGIEDNEPTTYRLGSNAMVNAPGVIRWAINGYKQESDREVMRDVVRSWEIPDEAVDALLSGEVPYEVDNTPNQEKVIFTYPAE